MPKLLFHNLDEYTMLLQAGLPAARLPLLLNTMGVAEILFGLGMLATWNSRWLFVLNAVLMVAALAAVAVHSPIYLQAAFNPATLNLAVIALSLCGWLALPHAPMARHCRRRPSPAEQFQEQA